MTNQSVASKVIAGLMIALLIPGGGCSVVQSTADLPGRAVSTVNPIKKKETNSFDAVEVQQTLLRFADELTARLLVGVERLRRGTNEVDAVETLHWKMVFATQLSSIVSGPNAVANLLDMTVFVTLLRTALQEHGQPNVFGEGAEPLLEVCREAETNIWRLAGNVLTPEQQRELRQAIQEWYTQNPLPESVLAARAVGFAAQLPRGSQAGTAKAGGVFDLLNLDPLSGLDPATREIAQTRLFAERALYVAHRTPLLLRLQAELTAMEIASIPAVQQLVTNSTQFASSAKRFAAVAENLPAQVSSERAEIIKALQSQEGDLGLLAGEFQKTLNAGSQMSASLNTTLTTFDGVMKRFGVGNTNSPAKPATNSEPFRIQDYTQSAAQLEATAKQLTELLVALDQTLGSSNLTRLSAQAGQVVQQAQLNGKELVNYALWKAVLFLIIAAAILLMYRLATTRLTQADASRTVHH